MSTAASAREAARDRTTGQFGAQQLSEPNVGNAGLEQDWGKPEPFKRHPHGVLNYSEDTVTTVMPGVLFVSTPGHGFYRLSPERQAVIPPCLRRSWYEEDCESSIISMYHGRTPEETEAGTARVADWFPDEYEKATGERLGIEDSYVRAQKVFKDLNAERFVTRSAVNSAEHPGMVEVSLSCQCTGEQRRLLVPRDVYSAPHGFGRYTAAPWVEPDGHSFADITPPPEPKRTAKVHRTVIDMSKVSPGRRGTVERDLGKMFRFPDGTVASVKDMIETTGVIRKVSGAHQGSDRRSYWISLEGGFGVQCSKSLWDLVDAPNETQYED